MWTKGKFLSFIKESAKRFLEKYTVQQNDFWLLYKKQK